MSRGRPGLARVMAGLGLCLSVLVGPAAPAHSLTRYEAGRFLTQATFGPTEEEVARLQAIDLEAWLDEQFALPSSVNHLSSLSQFPGGKGQLNHSFWQQALSGPDQLRQRVALALSEIFVVSTQDSCGSNHGRGVASYHDMLLAHAFGSYRDLLQAVTLHPVMGCYLSHLRNRRADSLTGRVPDENYAREVMQLFSIGLIALNKDGTQRLNAQQRPIETYDANDVSNLAKVFTGWSWNCPQYPSDECFQYRGTAPRSDAPDPWTGPMVPYPKFHDPGAKQFLGVKISEPRLFDADPESDLKIALNTLAQHPNVGPFIGKQLIMRLVTSNPSPAYVERVAKAFDASKGSLRVMIRAILMDPEARQPPPGTASAQGKVKEPILRLSALLRAFHASSATGLYTIGTTHEAAMGLNQALYHAPSVFNFFRPGYVAPGGQAAASGLVAPELQIANETSMAGYARFMEMVIWAGLGEFVKHRSEVIHPADVKLEYQLGEGAGWLDPTVTAEQLVERINQRLLLGSMSAPLRNEITTAVASISGSDKNQARRRLWSALLLTVVSPEYLVQR
jgi:uncharacterized protein (DUF1800 family)